MAILKRLNAKAPGMHFGLATAGALGYGLLASLFVACGSEGEPAGEAGDAGTAGSGSSGAPGGKGGSSGASAGTSNGSAGASAGSAGAGQGGSSSAGSAGAAGAGKGGSSSAGSAGGDAGGSGDSGTAGSAGSGGTSPAGTATFEVSSELASDLDPDAPTTVGIVTFSIDKAPLVSATIQFGLDTTYGMAAPVDLTLEDHRTLLLGMKPEKLYHFRVSAADAQNSYLSEDFTIQTGAKTTLVPLERFEVADEAARERGFIVGSYWQGMGGPVPFILDADGEVVWWYPNGPNGIARARMSADGKNMWMIAASNSGAALQRVSMDGLDAETYTGTTGSHDLTPVTGATMAYLDYSETDCDSIFEIDPSGTTREIWDSEAVKQGMCHGNALRYSKAEDLYTFSDVSTDIFAVKRSGELEWRLSELVSGGNDAWGGTQHGHQLLTSSIVVFANRGASTSASSVVEYSLDGGQELLNFDSGDFSANLGDVQRLPGGNTLITFSNDSIIKEIDADENVVLTIDGGGSAFGYVLWTSSLYDPAPDTEQ